jgi:hypothetical protein
MNLPSVLAVVALLLSLWPVPMRAQSDRLPYVPGAVPHAQSDADLEALDQRVIELYQAGRYGEVILLAEKSLELTRSQKGQDHVDTATRIALLAALYRIQGRDAEAELLYKCALAINEKVLGPDHPQVATSLVNLAGFYHTQGRYADLAYNVGTSSQHRMWGP